VFWAFWAIFAENGFRKGNPRGCPLSHRLGLFLSFGAKTEQPKGLPYGRIHAHHANHLENHSSEVV
jgi:hypothetical protein